MLQITLPAASYHISLPRLCFQSSSASTNSCSSPLFGNQLLPWPAKQLALCCSEDNRADGASNPCLCPPPSCRAQLGLAASLDVMSACSEHCPRRLGPSRLPFPWCWRSKPERAGEQLQKAPVCSGSVFRLPAGEQRAFQECSLGSFSFHLLHEPPHWAWWRTPKAAFLSS